MSDVELYESRTKFEFWKLVSPGNWQKETDISSLLPYAGSPEEQVRNASLYEFFRLVRYHGGKTPYLSWHEEDRLPITIMSPVLKLVEGPTFAFNARWALMQYHVWYNRSDFMEANDDEVKRRFRQWMDQPSVPWYIREEYVTANRRTRRTRRIHAKTKPTEAEPPLDGENLSESEGEGGHPTETESSSDEEAKMTHVDPDADMHILKMLYKGNLEESSRREEQTRKSHCVSHKHNVYRNTRCTSIWQEEQSALPGGVINTYLDSDDEDAYTGEQKEIVSASRTRRSMTISKRSKVAYPSPPCVLDHKVVVTK
jgi:hypothetical protein